MYTPHRKEIMNGVYLTCVPEFKFKTGCLSVTFVTPLDKKTAAMNSVLPSVLRRGTSRCPDMESIAAVLDSLYGAKISPVARKYGESLCIGFYAGFVDDEFIPGGEKILEGVTKLVGEMLLSPVTSGGRLKAEYVNGERENLISDIKAQINDKRGYSVSRLTEIMCRGERYGVRDTGTLADAGKITVASLTKYYTEVLATAPVEVFYCGSADPGRVEHAVREALADLPRGEIMAMPETEIVAEPRSAKPRYTEEKFDVTQGKLAMGFRLGKAPERDDKAVLMVMSALFGGTATSKLFLNVREKLSLCYFASSSIDTQKRIMVVSSGIDFANYETAKNEILAQLEAVKNGDFDETELLSAKRAVMTAIFTALDSVPGTERLYLNKILSGSIYSPAELAAMAEAVTKDDVVYAARRAKLDTVYFLTGEGEADET